METTVLNVKTNKHLKTQAQEIAKDLGVPLSVVINQYLRDFISTRKVTLQNAPALNPEILAIFEEAEQDGVTKTNSSQTFTTAKGAVDYLKQL